MLYSVMPINKDLSASDFEKNDQMTALKSEINFIAYCILKDFPKVKIVEIQTVAAILDIPDKSMADKIADDFDYRVDEVIDRQVVP